MKTIVKAVAGTLLAAGAVMAPLSMEASAAPAAAHAAVAPSFHPGNHHGYGSRHFDEWRRGCDDDRYDRYGRFDRSDRWRHHNHCRYDRWDNWGQYRYGNHHRGSNWDCD
ncbi:hypothetical protein ABZ478_38905 [Streptomyces sp. NPDC005706]|uniref:hypothetical protein n=1 Tax=Streptomyces sp. NPDC005706 TaxID=3157169 RepID=UPI0033E70D6A